MPDEARGRRGRLWAAAIATLLGALAEITGAQPAERLQACGACHGVDGNSTLAGSPSLAGQPRLFLENQLVLIR